MDKEEPFERGSADGESNSHVFTCAGNGCAEVAYRAQQLLEHSLLSELRAIVARALSGLDMFAGGQLSELDLLGSDFLEAPLPTEVSLLNPGYFHTTVPSIVILSMQGSPRPLLLQLPTKVSSILPLVHALAANKLQWPLCKYVAKDDGCFVHMLL